MPDDLKERLKAFVPRPAEAKIKTIAVLPTAYDLPYSRWNSKNRTVEEGTEEVPLKVHAIEGPAQRELLAILRLVDSGKVAVSDKTRRASAATVEAITNILEGGDFYPRLPVTNKWHDENAGPIRAFVIDKIVRYTAPRKTPQGTKTPWIAGGRSVDIATANQPLVAGQRGRHESNPPPNGRCRRVFCDSRKEDVK